jgi:hypothetical protein
MSEQAFVLISVLLVLGLAVGAGLIAAKRRGQSIGRRQTVLLGGYVAGAVAIVFIVTSLPPPIAMAIGIGSVIVGIGIRAYRWRTGDDRHAPQFFGQRVSRSLRRQRRLAWPSSPDERPSREPRATLSDCGPAGPRCRRMRL